MQRRTSERLVNLTIALLTARRFLPRTRLREMVEGYRDLSDVAFDRLFERDKQTLRDLGVPVETGTDERYFDDEPGYRIRRDTFELPSVAFDAEEVGVLVCAAQVWQQAATAETTVAALAKLWAGGTEPDTNRLAALRPHVSAREPAWQPLWEAVQVRQKVQFCYRGQQRIVQPWRLTWRGGAWYMAGFDETRDGARLFKLARLRGAVTAVGGPDAYQVPDIPAGDLFAGLTAARSQSGAVVDVRNGRAPWMTRRATLVGEADVPGWRRWRVQTTSVDDLAMAGADVRVVEPAELGAAVASHHAGLLERLGVTT